MLTVSESKRLKGKDFANTTLWIGYTHSFSSSPPGCLCECIFPSQFVAYNLYIDFNSGFFSDRSYEFIRCCTALSVGSMIYNHAMLLCGSSRAPCIHFIRTRVLCYI